MEQRIGYKVLTRNRLSAVVSRMSSNEIKSKSIYYPICKKAIPKGKQGPLCVFTTYSQAKAFKKIHQDGTGIIVKCHYKKSVKERVWFNNETSGVYIAFLPKGTILADSVTCLE